MAIIKQDFGEINTESQWCAWSQYYNGNGCTDTIATNLDIKYGAWALTRTVENDYFTLTCANGLPTNSVSVLVKRDCKVLKETWDSAPQASAQAYTPVTEIVTLTKGQIYTLSKVSTAFLIKLTVQ